MKKFSNSLKIIVGFIISGLFLYIAFQKINYHQMKHSFREANYYLFVPTLIILFFSHWLRSIRWYYLLKPIKKISITNLFSALMIGYMGNSIFPAHLGEFLRAYVIGRKENISVSSSLATIVIERIIDLFTLLLIMALALIIFPFPDWVKQSGYLLFFLTITLFIFLILLKKYTSKSIIIIKYFLRFLPKTISERIISVVNSFIEGVRELEHKKDYLIITLLSIFIWACYWFILHMNFYTFNLTQTFHLNIISSLVLLVITTISVVVPSSPGYVGTYHLLCQLSLELFNVPRSIGLTYAIVLHALNFIPVTIIGFIFAWKEGINLIKIRKNNYKN